jgi:hypothetical protein
MDHQQFDRLSRSMAAKTSRRQAIRQLGAGGLLGGAGAVFGARTLQAQDSAQTCALPIYAEVYVGPFLGTIYEGTLSLDIGADGAIDSGSLATLDGQSYPLVGHAAGRGLDVRIDLGNGQLLTLTGTAELDFSICQGDAAGSFAGPEMGNMGTWTTVSGGGPITPPGPGATETPNPCAAVSCFAPQTPNPTTCECECPAPGVTCGGACCAPDAACLDADAGICSCPAGTVECGGVCVAACGGGALPDPVSCECGPCPGVDCELGQLLNPDTCECEQVLCPAGTVACGTVCANLDNDPEHCGACDHVCPWMPTPDDLLPSLCVAGDCCLDVNHLCAADADCCSGACNFTLDGQVCA